MCLFVKGYLLCSGCCGSDGGSGSLPLQVCEMVKELVGYELSPLLFRPLFQCLRSSLRHIFDANDIAIVTPINSRLVDQVGTN